MAELDWICTALDHKCSMLDPYNFVDQPIAYIDHAETCFLLQLFKNDSW